MKWWTTSLIYHEDLIIPREGDGGGDWGGDGIGVGVSNRLDDPLNPTNPPVFNLLPPDPTTPAVERGFQTR